MTANKLIIYSSLKYSSINLYRHSNIVPVNLPGGDMFQDHSYNRSDISKELNKSTQCQNKDWWQANSLANVQNSHVLSAAVQNHAKNLPSENVSKFNHHRLW